MAFDREWSEIVSDLRQNYAERYIEEGEDRIEISFSGSTNLLVKKDGFVEGSMPLHHFETSEAVELKVQGGITLVRGEGFEYLFKK